MNELAIPMIVIVVISMIFSSMMHKSAMIAQANCEEAKAEARKQKALRRLKEIPDEEYRTLRQLKQVFLTSPSGQDMFVSSELWSTGAECKFLATTEDLNEEYEIAFTISERGPAREVSHDQLKHAD